MRSAACVLCWRDGKYLALSRRNDDTRWGMPGGKIDANETNAEGAAREFMEETGVFCTSLQLEPLFCGTSAGDKDFWVTTYLWIDVPVGDHELKPEAGLSIGWRTEEELCDEAISPFAVYNRRVFAAMRERANGS